MTEFVWTTSWAWGLPLIAITLGLHALAVGVSASFLGQLDRRMAVTPVRRSCRIPVLAAVIGTVGCGLAVMHGLEAAIWAAAYCRLEALASFGDAMLYSLDSITTRGASGLTLQRHWRLMGALEAADGVLLFGISTAFLFLVLERTWLILDRASVD